MDRPRLLLMGSSIVFLCVRTAKIGQSKPVPCSASTRFVPLRTSGLIGKNNYKIEDAYSFVDQKKVKVLH